MAEKKTLATLAKLLEVSASEVSQKQTIMMMMMMIVWHKSMKSKW